MREIKFRGIRKRLVREVANEWMYGDMFHTTENGDVCIQWWEDGFYKRVEVWKDTVGQFSGLYDKNGKEIYEGDILADSTGDIRHVVSYEDKEGAFIGTIPGMYDTLCQPLNTNLCQWWLNKNGKRVIGNIHDNPELIQK